MRSVTRTASREPVGLVYRNQFAVRSSIAIVVTPYSYSGREIWESKFPQQCDLNRSVKICALGGGGGGEGGQGVHTESWNRIPLPLHQQCRSIACLDWS